MFPNNKEKSEGTFSGCTIPHYYVSGWMDSTGVEKYKSSYSSLKRKTLFPYIEVEIVGGER